MKNVVILLLFLQPIVASAAGQICYPAGTSTAPTSQIILDAPANPSNADYLSVSNSEHQIVKWIDTGLIVNSSTPMQGTIEGSWYPWGKRSSKADVPCPTIACTNGEPGCLSTANGVQAGIKITKRVAGCSLSNGIGLYGTTVSDPNSNIVEPEPNMNAQTSDAPSSPPFTTFHFGSITNSNGEFNLNNAYTCEEVNGKYSCSPNTATNGRLYIKILDSYYGDNQGGYKITLASGSASSGFLTEVMRILDNTINQVSLSLGDGVLAYCIPILRVMLAIYFSLFCFFFMMGLSHLKRNELIIFIFKMIIISFAVGSYSTKYNPLFEGLTRIYYTIPMAISDIVARNSELANSNAAGSLRAGATIFSIYNDMFSTILSMSTQYKVWSLLFTRHLWYIPFLYLLLTLALLVIIRGILIFVVAKLQLALLLLVFPIMLVCMLFKTTATIFQKWLQYLASNCFMIIIVSVVSVITLVLIDKSMMELFSFGVCYGNAMSYPGVSTNLSNFSIGTQYVKFWVPNADYVHHVTITDYIAYLLLVLLSYHLMKSVPTLAQALSKSQLRPLAGAGELLSGVKSMITDSSFGKALNITAGLMGELLYKLRDKAPSIPSAPILSNTILTLKTSNRSGIRKFGRLLEAGKSSGYWLYDNIDYGASKYFKIITGEESTLLGDKRRQQPERKRGDIHRRYKAHTLAQESARIAQFLANDDNYKQRITAINDKIGTIKRDIEASNTQIATANTHIAELRRGVIPPALIPPQVPGKPARPQRTIESHILEQNKITAHHEKLLGKHNKSLEKMQSVRAEITAFKKRADEKRARGQRREDVDN